jgi:hypothetical protein
VKSSTIARMRKRRPSVKQSNTKSSDQRWFLSCGRASRGPPRESEGSHPEGDAEEAEIQRRGRRLDEQRRSCYAAPARKNSFLIASQRASAMVPRGWGFFVS